MKKTLIITLTLAMLLTCVMPFGVFAEGEAQPISTAAEFEAMSATGSYYLTGDIDFGGKDYNTGCILEDFSGTLDGKGYTIYNFSISSDVTVNGGNIGIFRTVCAEGAATIKNLQIGKADAMISVNIPATATTVNTEIGTIAAIQSSSANLLTIKNVDVYSIILPECVVGYSNVGGFVASAYNLALSDSTMHGKVGTWNVRKNGSSNAAGFISQLRGVGGTIDNCINYADISLYYDTTLRGAGIVGYINPDSDYTGYVKNCVNFGDIAPVDEKYTTPVSYRYVANGLFAGIVADIQNAGDGSIDSCINYGDIRDVNDPDNSSTRSGAGGILCWTTTANTVQNCVNYGTTTAAEETSKAGAIVALDESNGALVLTNNIDKSADVTAAPSEDVDTYGVQNSEVVDGKFNVRFIASLDTLDYTAVGFEIVAYYNDAAGVAATKTYNVDCTKVYNKLIAKTDAGIDCEVDAVTCGGQYIYALSIIGVPAVADNGNVTFVFRAVGKTADATVYGDTVACAYEAGEFLYCSNVG